MDRIKRLAFTLKRRFGTDDPFALCDRLDIPVLKVPLPERVRGFFTKICETKLVYVNTELPFCEAQLVCAHELGHALLHEDLNRFFITSSTFQVESRFEREADYFAVCVLVDDAKTLYEQHGFCTNEQIASFYGFEERMIALRYGNS